MKLEKARIARNSKGHNKIIEDSQYWHSFSPDSKHYGHDSAPFTERYTDLRGDSPKIIYENDGEKALSLDQLREKRLKEVVERIMVILRGKNQESVRFFVHAVLERNDQELRDILDTYFPNVNLKSEYKLLVLLFRGHVPIAHLDGKQSREERTEIFNRSKKWNWEEIPEISRELWDKIIFEYQLYLRIKMAELIEGESSLKTDFRKKIEIWKDKNPGIMPSNMIEDLEGILRRVRVEAVDPLHPTMSRENWEDCIGGSYQPHASIIRIILGADKEKEREIHEHEFIHLLSGHTLHRITAREDKVEVSGIESQRIGLSFATKEKMGRALNWLNEAVTESLNIEINGGDLDSEDFAYIYERKLLKRLLENGLRRDLLLRAYFENLDPKKEGEHLPAWQEFRKHLQEKGWWPPSVLDKWAEQEIKTLQVMDLQSFVEKYKK